MERLTLFDRYPRVAPNLEHGSYEVVRELEGPINGENGFLSLASIPWSFGMGVYW